MQPLQPFIIQFVKEFLWTFANPHPYPCELITYCDSMRGGYGKTYHLSFHKRSDDAILRNQGPNSIDFNNLRQIIWQGVQNAPQEMERNYAEDSTVAKP